MQRRTLGMVLGIFSLVSVTGTTVAVQPALAQGASVQQDPKGRAKQHAKESLQLIKDMQAFYNDPLNQPMLTEADVLALGKLTIAFSGGGAGQRRRGAGQAMSGGQYLGRVVALALEIYSRKHPGNYGMVEKLLLKGVPLNPANERTMHQLSNKLLEGIKPRVTPVGGGTVNPRARQRTTPIVPTQGFELAWTTISQLLPYLEQSNIF